jgi:hypothetical protein
MKTLEAILVLGGLGASSLFALFALNQYLLHRKYRHIPGPGTNSITNVLFGNIGDVRDVGPEGKSFAEKMLEW